MKYQKPKILSLGENIENAHGTCDIGNSAGTNTNKVCAAVGSSAGTGNDQNTAGCATGNNANGQCLDGNAPNVLP